MRISAAIGMVLAAIGICLGPCRSEAAGKYDGSAPLLCVPILITECGPEGECQRRTADNVNLPQFLKVDLKAQKVHSEETTRHSPIRNVEHLNGNLIIQGGQDGRGWTMTISEETGKMSATISSDGEGFVVFGACTLQ
jgi:hypothetical protein